MAERRRIRVRDGARHWSLLRDIADPRLWVESYQTPTWVEYVRHNMRRTKADAAATDRIHALHRGERAPRVLRRIVRQPRLTPTPPVGEMPIDHP